MAGKKWEDLEKDCLVNIFTRVGTESLLYDIPLVCKSWDRASLDPSCWKIINFQEFVRQLPLVDEYLKSIINRSQVNVCFITFSTACNVELTLFHLLLHTRFYMYTNYTSYDMHPITYPIGRNRMN